MGKMKFFEMVKATLSNPIFSIYIFAFIALGYHLLHGFQSAFQSLGLNHKNIPIIKSLGVAFSVVSAGFVCCNRFVNLIRLCSIKILYNSHFKIEMALNSKIPQGPLENKWQEYKGHAKLVNPANKRKLEVIVIGSGFSWCIGSSNFRRIRISGKSVLFSKIPHAVHTQLQLKAVSMLQKLSK